MPKMTNQQQLDLIKHVAELIFSVPVTDPRTMYQTIRNLLTSAEWEPWVVGGKVGGRTFKNSTTGLATLRGYDISLNLDELNPNQTIKLLNLRFIEQNPDKRDGYGNLKENAILTRQGNLIMWVIKQGPDGKFLGKLQNGNWIKKEPKAYNNPQNTYVQPEKPEVINPYLNMTPSQLCAIDLTTLNGTHLSMVNQAIIATNAASIAKPERKQTTFAPIDMEPIPEISSQNIEQAVTKMIIDEGTENECSWEGI